MSVTFTPETQKTPRINPHAVCRGCEGQSRYLDGVEPDPNCDKCQGFGGDSEAEDAYYLSLQEVDGHVNVANGNALFIFKDVLGLQEVEWCGEMEPEQVLLFISAYEAQNGTKATVISEHGAIVTESGVKPQVTFIECGRSVEQVQSYLDRLTKLANICLDRGEMVCWG